MIFTKRQKKYLSELTSTVEHALPNAPNPSVLFFLDDPVIHNYERLRSVWIEGNSIDSVCKPINRSRTEYYKLENAFMRHGIVAVYPNMGCRKQNPKLERLALLIKTARPKSTETMILRFSEALKIDPIPSLRTIGNILHCHGIGNNRDESDRNYWHGIQECIRSLENIKSHCGESRNKKNRKESFYNPQETIQLRFEMFRELALTAQNKVKKTVQRYGMSRPTFYKYLKRFRIYGPWGLIDWWKPGRGRVKLSEELELKIVQEKLEHPRISVDTLMARLNLRCARTWVYEVLKFWNILQKDRAPVKLRGLFNEENVVEPKILLKTAKDEAKAGKVQMPSKTNGHFSKLLNRLKSHPLSVCDPGPIILAQFVDDLGICEAIRLYGPKRKHGGETTNLVLLNVCRILAGYETVSQLNENSDRSVAIASGAGVFPGKTALYDGFSDLKFEHLQLLRNDVVARARDLGLIRGERIAHDFHFKEFYGQSAEEEEIGKGPNSAGDICPGYRPHVVWDLDTDVLINIAFCNGSSRATKIVREFCEKNLYPILDRDAIKEIYMDSEYTSFPVIDYFVVDEFSDTDVIMCLKRNKKIDQLKQEVKSDATWEPYGKEYEIAGKRFQLKNLGKELHFIVKRNKNTGSERCFGTTVKGLENREILERYRLRWPIENGLRDLIHSYFIDHILGKDPEKIELNFYCVQVARLAYELFLRSLDDAFVRDSSGHKKTLSTFRALLFGRHNCELRLRGNNLELTYLDLGEDKLPKAIKKMLNNRSQRGLNKVYWWGGCGLNVEFKNQYTEPIGSQCSQNVSE